MTAEAATAAIVQAADSSAACTLEPTRHGGLAVEAGFASRQATRHSLNEDFFGAVAGRGADAGTRGSVWALADGMGGTSGGRVAAELAVRGFLEAYYQSPATLSPLRAAARALEAVNGWLHAQGRTDPALRNMGAAFAALVLRGRQAFLIAAGDVRLYRLRAGRLQQLGEDHLVPSPQGWLLARAVGMERELVADVTELDVEVHDRFLLCSDGAYRDLSSARLRALLDDTDPQEAARGLVASAALAGSIDDASAAVIDVLGLPDLDDRYLERLIGSLPIERAPEAGETVDGYRLQSVLHEGRYSRVFQACDAQNARWVMKFPLPNAESDENIRRAFVREGWIAGRLRTPWIVAPQWREAERRSRLYLVMPYHAGETLERRLNRRVDLAEGLRIAAQLARAVDALNRHQVYHRDIKPDNVFLTEGGELRLLDLGLARLAGVLDPAPPEVPGTPSYMAPELVRGAPGDERSEVFAYAVTLYRMFAGGAFPYTLRGRVSLHRHRPDLPPAFDRVFAKALADDPAQRQQDVLEMDYELEYAAAHAAQAPPHDTRSLYARNPVLVWQMLSAVLAAALLAALFWR
ncbi:MAG: bifunctional protein-serine/threonine kinase/phosphatase [Acidihalobacter sp.]